MRHGKIEYLRGLSEGQLKLLVGTLSLWWQWWLGYMYLGLPRIRFQCQDHALYALRVGYDVMPPYSLSEGIGAASLSFKILGHNFFHGL